MNNLNNGCMSIRELQDILLNNIYVVFDLTDTSIALSIEESLEEILDQFFLEFDDPYKVTTEEYQLIVNDLFAFASEILSKY